ncbi:MAG: hypothetical protein PWQ23_909 [Thermoanaerobacter sp.]|nr:hypothetical protein [Thermoanaerobacter sp.]
MKKTIDIFVAEVGSTTTTVNAFILGNNPVFIGQGVAPTTVLDGDVNIGLEEAIEDLKDKIGDFVIVRCLLVAVLLVASK